MPRPTNDQRAIDAFLDHLSLASRYCQTLVASACSGVEPPVISTEVWPQVLGELQVQTVLAIPYAQIKRLGLPEKDWGHYRSLVMKQVAQWHAYMSTQDEVLAAFEEAGIPVAVLKGAAAAMNYPDPGSRTMGDIDLIVKPADFDRAYSLMESTGWTCSDLLDDDSRHAGFFKSGCPEVELHRYFSPTEMRERHRRLDSCIYEGIDQAVVCEVLGHRVRSLPPVANGLVLLCHINHHLGSGGLGLRQILDWQFFVRRYLDDAMWEGQFSQLTDALGLTRLALTTTAACEIYFGLSHGASWYAEADVNLAGQLAHFVMNKGNFGCKDDYGKRATLSVLKSFRNPIKALSSLYKGGYARWEPARTHKWLAPIACLYQVGHLIRKGLSMKVSVSGLRSESNDIAKENELLKRLGVTRIRQ